MAPFFSSKTENVFTALGTSTGLKRESHGCTRYPDGDRFKDDLCREGIGRFGLLKWLPAHSIKIGIIVIAAVILCSELLFLTIFNRSTHKQNKAPSLQKTAATAHMSQWTDCGNSTQSALQRGCIFDVLTISWETPNCYQTDIVNDFLQLKPWQPFTDVNGTAEASWDDVARAERRYNVNWDFHFTHCIYSWRMLQMAVLERRPLGDNLLALDHTRHCIDILLDQRWTWDYKVTLIHVKWPKCYPHGQWNEAHFVDTLDPSML